MFPDTNFNIEYGDGEFLTGTVGFDTVSVAGLTVIGQEIGIATYVDPNLCQPSLTANNCLK